MNWLRREDLEDQELRTLHRHAAQSRSATRRREEPHDPLRTAFQRDRDRIIHSPAFRRLQHKTQVVAAYEGDHYRSRMTHSLEVSQMARAAAQALGLNMDLTEAIALAHDLGHPPFGHVGEEALHELMQEHGGFRHNAQGVRIVDRIEDPYETGFGLNLTDATRRAMLKGRIPDGFPLADDLSPENRRPTPLEAALVDRCDKIAYICHDLDDGIRAGAFGEPDAARLALWQRAREQRPDAGRRATISLITSLLMKDLVATTAKALAEHPDAPRIRQSDALVVESEELFALLRERFYRSRRVLVVMERGQERIRRAYEHFVSYPEELSDRARRRLDADGVERTACDHVAGMTDRYLLRVVEGIDAGTA